MMAEISDNLDFNYIHILRLLYSKDSLVRLLAGGALAAFSYNSLGQQQEIEESGGVRHHCFVPFLESSDEFYRCNAAFQVRIKYVPGTQWSNECVFIVFRISPVMQTEFSRIL